MLRFAPGLRSWLALALFAAGVAACAVSPVTGERELALLTEADELQLGRDNDLEIRKQYGVVDNPALQTYVQQVGERLAAKSHRPQLKYTFTVLDSAEVNAFALPGGYVYVTRGILAHLNSEAELAAVLGHEIGHVTARHAVRRYSAAVAANLGVAVGSILAPELGTRAGQTLVNILGGALLSGYGREQELEADHLGAEYLARSDYDPQAMIEVIGLLKNQELLDKQLAEKEGRAPRAYHGLFASHPSADQRLQQVVSGADKHRTAGTSRTGRDDYLRRLQGLAFGDSAAQGIRRGNAFYHRGLNFGVRFPEGWQLDNSPERLLARHPDGNAVLEMQVTARGAARTPQEYLVVNMQLRDLREPNPIKVGALPGYTAISRMQTPFGARDTRVAVVFLNKQAFRFFGVARDVPGATKADDTLERLFLDSVHSLHVLRPDEHALAQGRHLDIVAARAGDTFAKLARQGPLGGETENVLRLLNGRYPQGEPQRGQLIKRLR